MTGLVEPDREVSPDALTAPREQYVPADEHESRRGRLFRRHRTPVAHPVVGQAFR